MAKTWRDEVKPIIAMAILENTGKSEIEIRRILRDLYPYGERKYHPYKIWCDEINVQLKVKAKRKSLKDAALTPNQTELFKS